jgi:hypothetical protein
MVDYSSAEILNEISGIFRASLAPARDGGTLNTREEYQQLLEMSAATLLLYPDALFYVSKLAANKLSSTIVSEVAILEDLLVALDDLGQIGSPVTDTATLSNARTAVLSLEAAQSLTNRPESQRFIRQMDSFAGKLRGNLVSTSKPGIARPREESRNLIRANLTSLKEVHESLLSQIFSLKDVLDDYLSLDLPARVSTTVLSSISKRLQATIANIAQWSDITNLAANRKLFLESLANKISVRVLSSFTDPSEWKYRSPTRPIPSTAKHYGRVIGQGTPASIITNGGPWTLPITAPLILSVSGGPSITLALNSIKGAMLGSRNTQTFPITAAAQNLHVVVDSQIRSGTITTGTTGAVETIEFLKLGFKHLGSIVYFPGADCSVDPTDLHARFITDMRVLQSATAAHVLFANPVLTMISPSAGDEGAIGFQAGHVGSYIKDSVSRRFEIVKVLSATRCELDTRGAIPNLVAGLTLRGQRSSGTGTSKFDFLPVLTSSAGDIAGTQVKVGPSVKTASLTVGNRSVANIISDIQAETGVYETGHDGAKLNWHVAPEAMPGDPTRLCLRIRSKLEPSLQVASRFLRPRNPVGLAAVNEASAHTVLGFLEGESDATNTLSTSELIALINAQSGVMAELVTTEIYSGYVKTSAALSRVTSVDGTSFTTIGVLENDHVALANGGSSGTYPVAAVAAAYLDLTSTPFVANETLTCRIFREQVRVSITDAGPETSLKVVSAPSELGLAAGTTYSSIPTFDAVDKLGNQMDFSRVVVGDLLRVAGMDEVAITEITDGTVLSLESGLPSTATKVGFTIRSAAAKEFGELHADLTTFTESNNLLKKNKFDENVEAVDNACTLAVLPGMNFASSRNQARKMVSDLLSILSSVYPRLGEYATIVTADTDNLWDSVQAYSADKIVGVDALLTAFLDRKYDRAADLLRSGRFSSFFNTTDETGSYSGAVTNASRRVVRDLPQVSRTRFDFLNHRDLAVGSRPTPDADQDFSDVENEPEDFGL